MDNVQSIFAMVTPDDPTRGRRYAGWLKIGERRYGLKCIGFTDSDVCRLPARPAKVRKSRKNATKELNALKLGASECQPPR